MSGTIRPDTIAVSGSTPTLSSKSLPALNTTTKQTAKPAVTAPRIDVEPLYTTLKSGMGDAEWSDYKVAVSKFMMGNLNQTELSHSLRKILRTPSLEHAHNQFIVAIFGNIFRDPPESGVASWVSANDKPTTGTGNKPAGDEAEKRLKHEVMQLSRRERKRLKMIQQSQGDGWDRFQEEMMEYHRERTIRIPEVGMAGAGGFQKTNWDLEIRRRYAQPLFTETHEFPDTDSIAARMVPIAYENGLPGGAALDCAAFMNIATETYIKEALSNVFSRVMCNGDKYIKTAAFKRRVEEEERRVERGEIGRTAGGYLPCEVEEIRRRRALGMEDIRLALELGDSYLGQVPLISGAISNGRYLDFDGVEEIYANNGTGRDNNVNGIIGPATHLQSQSLSTPSTLNLNLNLDLGDRMDVDDDWGWQGGQVNDVDRLDNVLDGCLAVGS
ncbi:hypothetical protein GQ43DRAFT_439117 [Delitschia confertaspora ATCC 74209]|uniref:Transcriptional co-activator n=1 Tax=Delitschia confertaspora ATCC 74209 TaxID=1513339 RepID=A0A9P4JQ41_9PLEO|nr:hypothetical protein GQ43DRAFT_439117 [Delitschia confertaspora ATCC 74209]